ncbi:hypothetical protein B0H12DRAFT_1103034, partial [Mycena haematopus]
MVQTNLHSACPLSPFLGLRFPVFILTFIFRACGYPYLILPSATFWWLTSFANPIL